MNIQEIKDDNFLKTIDGKRLIIEKQIDLQEQKKTMLFEYCNTIINVMSIAKNVDNNWDDILKKLKESIEILSINMQQLKSMKSDILQIEALLNNIKSDRYKGQELNDKLEDFNKRVQEYNIKETEEYPQILDKSKENEELINQIIRNANEILSKENELKEENKNINIKENKKELEKEKIENETIAKNIENGELKDNRVLIVSEMEGKVYLPYYAKDINEQLIKNKNTTVEDLIKEKYVLDIKRFKNPITARFREAYNLIRKRDKGSIFEAIDLGMELMLNYSLNPAVIAACINQDELDIYLDCLEENELDQFEIFDIKYISAPMIVKQRKSKHEF